MATRPPLYDDDPDTEIELASPTALKDQDEVEERLRGLGYLE
jgi:hypothetical protein